MFELIIYAKENGLKYTTILATGMDQIGWRRLLLGHGDDVKSFQPELKVGVAGADISRLLAFFRTTFRFCAVKIAALQFHLLTAVFTRYDFRRQIVAKCLPFSIILGRFL